MSLENYIFYSYGGMIFRIVESIEKAESNTNPTASVTGLQQYVQIHKEAIQIDSKEHSDRTWISTQLKYATRKGFDDS